MLSVVAVTCLTGVPCSRVHPPAGRIISICVLAPGYYVEILQCRLIYFTLKFYRLLYYLYPEEGKSFVFELIPSKNADAVQNLRSQWMCQMESTTMCCSTLLHFCCFFKKNDAHPTITGSSRTNDTHLRFTFLIQTLWPPTLRLLYFLFQDFD